MGPLFPGEPEPPRRPLLGGVLVAVSVLVYAGALLHLPQESDAAGAFFVLTLLLAGAFFGLPGGLATALLGLPLTWAILVVDGAGAPAVAFRLEDAPRMMAALAIGAVAGSLSDAHQRNRRQLNALQQSEALQRSLMETAFDGIAIHEGGVVRQANASFAAMYGYAPQELVGRPVADLVDPTSWSEVDRRLRAPDDGAYEIVGIRKDGGRVILEVAARDCVFEGRPARMTAVRDVTARRQVESDLRESEERFRAIMEASFDGVLIHRDGIILDANVGLHHLMHAPPGALLGTSVFDLVEPEDRASSIERARSQREETSEVHLRRPDGTHLLVLTLVKNCRFDGAPARIVGVRDVTELRRSERALRESEERFRTAFDEAAVGLALVSADGTVRQVNRALLAMTGFASGEVVGQGFESILHPDERKGAARRVRALLDDKRRAMATEVRLVRKAGGELWAHAGISVVRDGDGRPVQLIAQLVDVTERRRVEAQRDALARQDRLSALGTLMAGVAHEVNNPLTYMLANIELCVMDLQAAQAAVAKGAPVGDLDPTIQRLESTLGGADRIANITRALKAVSKARPGDAREVVDMGVVLSNVEALLRVGVPRGVQVRFDRAQGVDLRVDANAPEMHQILLNLAQNAIDAVAEKGGSVTVRADASPGTVEVLVEDDGPGISPDLAGRLFTPFVTTKQTGTGLGLSIVQAIVQAHGGTIEAGSSPAGGARFHVRLPARPSPVHSL